MIQLPNQRFIAMLGLSCLLHATIFAGLTWQRQAPRQLQPLNIIATLRQAVSANTAASIAPTPSLDTAPKIEAVAKRPRLVAPAALPQQAKQPRPRREHLSARGATGAAEPPSVAVATTEPLMASATLPAAATQAAPPAAAVPVTSVPQQSSLLAAYRQRLTEIFAGQQTYPRIAALRGWEGEVRLRLLVARKGNLLAVHLDRSSGFDILDQHALAILDQLAILPPLPDGLEANEIQVVVPISYKLKKTT